MKHYLTFQIIARKDKYSEKFTDQQRKEITQALNFRGTFTDWYRIEIQAKYITQEQPAETKQLSLL